MRREWANLLEDLAVLAERFDLEPEELLLERLELEPEACELEPEPEPPADLQRLLADIKQLRELDKVLGARLHSLKLAEARRRTQAVILNEAF